MLLNVQYFSFRMQINYVIGLDGDCNYSQSSIVKVCVISIFILLILSVYLFLGNCYRGNVKYEIH